MAEFYPNGRTAPGNGPPDTLGLNNESDLSGGNDPSWLSGPYLEMAERWQPILICIGGTKAFRENAVIYLPREPREDEAAWLRRVSKAVVSPFLTRIADQAAGLITRKAITLQMEDPDQEPDEWWQDFIEDVDGFGTDITTFARRTVLSSLLLGHSAIMVDFPSTEAAPNLQVERELGLRPYWIDVRADQLLGWKKDGDSPIAPIGQIRINEYVQENVGEFGDRTVRQIRVLERGSWSLWRQGDDGWFKYQEGTSSLPVIPLAVTYSGKVSELISNPPLLPISQINLLHAARQADLNHSLHVASMPILVLKGWDDSDNEIALSANSAIVMGTESEAFYVEPASSAFDSQQRFITELEQQMENLSISTLFHQTYAAETAEAKALNRTDSDSMLAVVARDLEKALQNALDMTGMYVGREAPKVHIDKDFELQMLDHQQVAEYQSMYSNGVITHETLLNVLKAGEVLPDLDVEAEVEAVEAAKLNLLDLNSSGGVLGESEENAEEEPAEGDSEVRRIVTDRLRRMAGETEEDDS